ncbi:glycerol-3-phosphate acyltransferase 1, mitochondrial [Trachemys scripta elegans]|uniref:glycerol-3-phosphate acyltransferase 1, mitochondrial n=1 Tax=Trachemys scripta elegans TaxID=31138 RepID=UPI001551F275|nr:glycerol-3-phosphate acyltransferase 1, mitochondrial [Trachemys scripta elegans]XP_053890076.1 glycerol-3-phosphate acyltransferase 1, mitochondrial [Malaclemys terrapin pileata]XP_053890077.1 glycerol-3-phosphate acyltransferase 1, mitochondrial [Malaclemys terrapin pileata]
MVLNLSCVMDEAALSLGTIDVSYLSSSVEYAITRCKHSSEEWGECNSRPTVFRSATLKWKKWKETLLSRKRPFVGRCCYMCTPQSRDKLFNASIPSLGLRNVIYINETHTRYRGWLARRLCYVLFVQERDVHKSMFASNVAENVLNSSRVQKAIVEEASVLSAAGTQTDLKAISKVKKKARRILQEMVANVSPALIRLTGWVLLKLFNSFFWNIQIHKGQLEMVKAATKMNLPLIFLPVHKSHIDYLLLTFVLFCHNIKAPYIAAGNNLNIPIFSTLIRKLGGFFIRRRLDENPHGRKDVLYRALLYVHIEELLRQQQFLEIFLEGTRSRSGKTSCARAGLLSVVVDALFTNATPDILIIPVGISYDRIIEGHYNNEQLGKPKKNESLWSVARGVFRMLRKNYGCVRVDFAQPFSLKEYLDSQSQKPMPAMLSLEQALLPAILPSRPNDVVDEVTEATLGDSWDLSNEPFRRQLIANLAEHILFTANKSCAVMSTHIVACLLLYRHRKGIDLSKLVEDFFSMKEEVLARDFDLGFSGNSEDVVMHAIHLLGNCVNITNTSQNNEFFITPSTTIPAVFELNFYSNGVLHVFIKEAIIACSLHAVQSKRYRNGINGVSPNLISQEQLVRKAASLCHLLSNEGAISLPCQMLYQVCHEAVERFIQYGILLVAEQDDQEDISPSLTEQQWSKKLPEPLSWRSDEEDEDSDFGEEQRDCYLKVNQSQEHQQYITFLQRLLGPLLEAYSSAAIFMHNFSGPVSETEYLHKLHKYLITRTEKSVAVYAESATYCLVKNAVKVFKDIGVFKETKQKRETFLELSSTFLPQRNRQKLLEFILSFIVL